MFCIFIWSYTLDLPKFGKFWSVSLELFIKHNPKIIRSAMREKKVVTVLHICNIIFLDICSQSNMLFYYFLFSLLFSDYPQCPRCNQLVFKVDTRRHIVYDRSGFTFSPLHDLLWTEILAPRDPNDGWCFLRSSFAPNAAYLLYSTGSWNWKEVQIGGLDQMLIFFL